MNKANLNISIQNITVYNYLPDHVCLRKRSQALLPVERLVPPAINRIQYCTTPEDHLQEDIYTFLQFRSTYLRRSF